MGESDPSTPISVHQALGGGSVADLLLWRRKLGAVFLLGSATTFWYLFERAGYNFLSFVATVLLFLVLILFFWAKSATLLNRPLPPLPNLELSEASALKAADALQVWINEALSVAREIAVDRDLKRLLQVGFLLWIVSCLGNLFNILTLIYIGVVISLTIPVIYEKYQDHIDDKLRVTHRIIQTQYRRVDDSFLKKLPMPMNKEKKIE